MSLLQNDLLAEIHGVEPSQAMLKALQARLKITPDARVFLQPGKVEQLPYADSYFERVVSVNTLYFWPDLTAGLRELYRVLANDGKLVLGFASPEALNRQGYHEQGFQLYPPQQLIAELQRAGFSHVQNHDLVRGERGIFHVVTALKTEVLER